MKKLLVGVAVVSGVFFGQAAAHADSTKWQQFCEAAATDASGELNGRLKQLGEDGWELTGLTPNGAGANLACFKRPWRASAAPLAATPVKLAPLKLVAAPSKAAPVVTPPTVAKQVVAPPPVAKQEEVEPQPAITAAAADVMAAPSVTQAPPVKASQAQTDPTPTSRSLVPDEQNEAPRPRRALVPKS